MKILAVDTTWDNMVVALYSNDKVCSSVSFDGAKKHNSQILPMIDNLLEEAGVKIGDIDYFSAVVGPGSFTGIRIGVSTVNALAFACGKNTVEVNELEVLAYPCSDREFYTAIDCRHDCYYYGKFGGSFDNMLEIGEITANDLNLLDCRVVKKESPCNAQDLIEVCKSKIKNGKISNMLAPLYLKKSQAEREYEAKNMDKTDI